jgi:hypothetical protein
LGFLTLLPQPGRCGEIWLAATSGGNYVFEVIDPSSGAVVQTLTHAEGTITSLAGGFDYGNGYLWLAATSGGNYVFEKIDPSSGAVLQTITHAEGTITSLAGGFAVGNGYLWLAATSGGNYIFEKIDPSSGAVLQTITHAEGTITSLAGGFAVGNGYLWLAATSGGNYIFEKIDPSSGAVLQTITHAEGTITSTAGGFAAGDGYLWLAATSGANYVFEKIDPSSGAVLQTITHAEGTITSTAGGFAYAEVALPAPPSAPTATQASAVSATGFTANWDASSGATGYQLDVSTSSTFGSFLPGYQNLNVGNSTSHAVTGLSEGTTYYYRARAYNAVGTSGNSAVISVVTLAAPSAPTATQASAVSATGFTANWDASPGATGYNLDVSTSSAFGSFLPGYQNLDVGNSTSHAVTGLSASTTYYYRVRAYNAVGTSGNSAVISVMTTPGLPPSIAAQPNNLTAISGQSVVFSVSANGSPPLAYQWQFDGTDLTNNAQILGSQSNVLTVLSVTMANSGAYQVIVTNDYGATNASATLTVNRATPLIMWTNPAAITYGTALNSNQLNAMASVPGGFAYSPTNGTVLNAGINTLTVILTPTDTVDYNSATSAVSLVVSPAPLIVTAANASRGYGQTNPVFTGTIIGVTNGDNITATYSCNATSNSPPGAYPIVPSLVDPNNRKTNYTVSVVDGTLTVGRLTPTLTWTNPAVITYGTALNSNQLNAMASVPGSFAYSPTNGTVLNAGINTLTVILTPTDTVVYNSATSAVSLVVSPAPLIVTAANASRTYGQTNPVFTGTIIGVTNGDNITATYSCSATSNSPAGAYPIVPSLVDPNNRKINYTVSLVTATLTVNYAGVYFFTTLAGLAESQGTNDGTGSAARFSLPLGVAVDGADNVYVADNDNQTIRKVTPAGVVTTLAGLAGTQGTNDGTGSAARFEYPYGLAVDRAGNVYVADQGNDTIRKVTPAGAVTTLAGLPGTQGTNDGTGSAARFSFPAGVAVDNVGNVYVADNHNDTIRKVTPAGVVTTLAGLGGSPGSADGTGSAARFSLPLGVAVDSADNVYVADNDNQTIRKVTPAGVVTTLAGLAGTQGTNDGTGSAARFSFPGSVTVDGGGNIYVADTYNQTIRKVTPAGAVTTLAGLAGTQGTNDGTGSAARFSFPWGVAVDFAGDVYVADNHNDTIRKGYIVGPPAQGVFDYVLLPDSTITPHNGPIPTGPSEALTGFFSWASVIPSQIQDAFEFNVTSLSFQSASYSLLWDNSSPQFGSSTPNGPYGQTALDANVLWAQNPYAIGGFDQGTFLGTPAAPSRLIMTEGLAPRAGGYWVAYLYIDAQLVSPPVTIQTVSRSGGLITFDWSAIPGQIYQVQYKTNLNQPNWTALGGTITATTSTLTASDVMDNLQRFYRVVLLP